MARRLSAASELGSGRQSNEALRAEFLATCRVAVGAVLANG